MAQLAVAAVMVVGSLYKGAQEKKLKEEEAVGYRQAANRRMAAATREMAEEERNKETMYSRALAVAAASGGGTQYGVTKILADLNAEGEYRIFSRLWSGEDEAEGLRFRADQAEREGDAAVQASYINAVTSAVSAYNSFGSAPSAASAGAGASGATAAIPKGAPI